MDHHRPTRCCPRALSGLLLAALAACGPSGAVEAPRDHATSSPSIVEFPLPDAGARDAGRAGCSIELGCPADAGRPGTPDAGGCVEGPCTTSCGSVGTWSCALNRCVPPAERCDNGQDDDCDGLVDCDDPACSEYPGCRQPQDAGFVCVSGSCTTACGSSGTWSCEELLCRPPQEDCTNGVDDDCNGLSDCDDPACAGTAACCSAPVVCGVIGCNGDWGENNLEDKDTAPCWQDPGACTPENLDAWCTRRGDTSDLWPSLVEQSVRDNCAGGTVQDVSPIPGEGFGDQFQCLQNGCLTYTCNTPLVLAFDPGQAVAYRRDDGRGAFDLSAAGDGSAVRTDWPTAATPWLAMDRDGDGQITSGRELFGSATQLGDRTAENGFQALAALDANGDGVLDARDPAFARLLVWTDRDGDRRFTPDELQTLAEAGVTAIRLGYRVQPRCDARGNCEVERATFTFHTASGEQRQGAVIDVHLRTQSAGALVAQRP